jgi:hypothetical protein
MLYLFNDNQTQRAEALKEVHSILISASFDLFINEHVNESTGFLETLNKGLENSKGAVMILSEEYGNKLNFENGEELSFAEFQFNQVIKRCAINPNFKLFVWYPPHLAKNLPDEQQINFINKIRNSLGKNMVFTNVSSPIEFVDDIRSSFEEQETKAYDLKETEVFLISNQLDESEAEEVADMLRDIVSTENVSIVQDSDIDYSEMCAQQIKKSKLAVVYFKTSSDWAVPFAQEIWKKVGGADTKTPILLIGDSDPDYNKDVKLRAPKVVCMIVDGILIPLEIKVQYDKAKEGLIL